MSEQPAALITVRTSSGRLPKKCFLQLGGRSVLEHVIERAANGGFRPIVCTSIDKSDLEIVELSRKLNVEYFQGDLENKLNRWKMCMGKFNLSNVHLVDADDPYFDPVECHESYALLADSPFDLVLTSQKSDSGFASVGTSITMGFIEKIVDRSKELKSSNFDVIPWELLLNSEDSFLTKPASNIGTPSDIDMRLTLDYPEDHWMLSILAMNFPFNVPRVEVEHFLVENPTVRQINLFRNQDFANNKKNFKSVQFN